MLLFHNVPEFLLKISLCNRFFCNVLSLSVIFFNYLQRNFQIVWWVTFGLPSLGISVCCVGKLPEHIPIVFQDFYAKILLLSISRTNLRWIVKWDKISLNVSENDLVWP